MSRATMIMTEQQFLADLSILPYLAQPDFQRQGNTRSIVADIEEDDMASYKDVQNCSRTYSIPMVI